MGLYTGISSMGTNMGRIAYVDLSRSKIIKKSPRQGFYRQYIGGRGIASRILWDQLPPRIDPFDPSNVLIFSVGPFTGTIYPCAGRFTVTAKSPQTFGLGYSNCGGSFAATLKYAGFDALVITGRAKSPVWLDVSDGELLIHSAKDIWGRKTDISHEILLEETGGYQANAAVIGPAGENLVRYACIMADKTRAAGRTGMGAVMGAKRLKGVVVHGTHGIRPHDPETFNDLATDALIKTNQDPGSELLKKYGTPYLVEFMQMGGSLPAKNMQVGQFPGWEKLSGDYISKHYQIRSRACFSCPIACGKITTVTEGPYKGLEGEGVEWESLNALGPMLWNGDWGVIKKANELCAQYGLDTISTGVVLAMVMELWEKGILTEKGTNGIAYNWGDSEVILDTIRLIASRQGFGKLLGEGVKIASETIGSGAEYYALHVKGVELPRQEPRLIFEWGLSHAISNRGADHLYSFPVVSSAKYRDILLKLFDPSLIDDLMNSRSWKGKAEVCVWGDHYSALCDMLGICKFHTMDIMTLLPEDFVASYRAATGFNLPLKDLMLSGERLVNLERSINIRERDATRNDDMVPSRFLKEKLRVPGDESSGYVIQLEPMLDRYYELRGWDQKTGRPTQKTLNRLELNDVAESLGNKIIPDV